MLSDIKLPVSFTSNTGLYVIVFI